MQNIMEVMCFRVSSPYSYKPKVSSHIFPSVPSFWGFPCSEKLNFSAFFSGDFPRSHQDQNGWLLDRRHIRCYVHPFLHRSHVHGSSPLLQWSLPNLSSDSLPPDDTLLCGAWNHRQPTFKTFAVSVYYHYRPSNLRCSPCFHSLVGPRLFHHSNRLRARPSVDCNVFTLTPCLLRSRLVAEWLPNARSASSE